MRDRPGIAADVVQVAREPAELGFGPFEPLAGLVQVAALDRLDGIADEPGIEPAAAALDERSVDLERQPAGVLFEAALGLGQLLEGVGLLRDVARLSRQVALPLGQRVGLPCDRVGGVGLRRPGHPRAARVTYLSRASRSFCTAF